jgi:hypothetical protein
LHSKQNQSENIFKFYNEGVIYLSLFDTMLNFVENLLENERGPMNDQDLTKTDYDPDRSLVLIEGLSHFLTNFLQNLESCQTSFTDKYVVKIISFNCQLKIVCIRITKLHTYLKHL